MLPKIIISDHPEEEFVIFLQSRIREFNDDNSPDHRIKRNPDYIRPLNLILKSDQDVMIGGLSGKTYWGWLEIVKLFIPIELRGKGIGSSLLQTAEAIAMERGVNKCFLTTFEFQARIFYEDHGYIVTGKLEGYPPSSTYYWMKKELP